jgi:hypothetical protein
MFENQTSDTANVSASRRTLRDDVLVNCARIGFKP